MPVWLKNPYLNRKTTVPNLAHTFCFRFNLKENSNKYLKTLADIWCLVFGLQYKKHVYRKCSVTLHSQTGSLDALRVPEVRNDVETDTDLSSDQENGKYVSLFY